MEGVDSLYTAEASAQETPGAIFSIAASCASRTVLYIFFCSSLTEPTATVRVMSLWYPPTTAP